MTNFKPLLTTLFVGVLIASVLSDQFISLPAYVQCFDQLTVDNIDVLRYTTKGLAFGIVYGIYNTITHQIYVGSTINPVVRFYEHLISGINSNNYLQNAIAKYGLQSFTVLIFEIVENSVSTTKQILLHVEQKYLDLFPTLQKYNFATAAGGGGRPMSPAERVSGRMIGINVGRAPINKGVPLTLAAKQLM